MADNDANGRLDSFMRQVELELGFAETLWYCVSVEPDLPGVPGSGQEKVIFGKHLPSGTVFIPIFTSPEKAAAYLWGVGYGIRESSLVELDRDKADLLYHALMRHQDSGIQHMGIDCPMDPQADMAAMRLEYLKKWADGEDVSG